MSSGCDGACACFSRKHLQRHVLQIPMWFWTDWVEAAGDVYEVGEVYTRNVNDVSLQMGKGIPKVPTLCNWSSKSYTFVVSF